MLKKTIRVASGLLVVVALSACGGSSSSNSENTDDAGSSDNSVELVEGNDCETAASAFAVVNQDVIMALGMPDSLDVDKLKDNIEKAKAAVPSEIETEFALFADTYGEIGEVLSSVAENGGLTNPDNAAQIADIEAKLENEDFAAAMDRLQEFFLSECTP